MGLPTTQWPEETTATETDTILANISSKSRKISIKNIFEKILFSALGTTNKSIIGAINELNTKIEKKASTTTLINDYLSSGTAVTRQYTVPDITQYDYIIIEIIYAAIVRDNRIITPAMKATAHSLCCNGVEKAQVVFESNTLCEITFNELYYPVRVFGVKNNP